MDAFAYSARLGGFRGQLFGLPSWARALVFLAALPGIVLGSLSILALLVSILALLLPTVPLYLLLRKLTGDAAGIEADATEIDLSPVFSGEEPQRKRVEATVVDPPDDRQA